MKASLSLAGLLAIAGDFRHYAEAVFDGTVTMETRDVFLSELRGHAADGIAEASLILGEWYASIDDPKAKDYLIKAQKLNTDEARHRLYGHAIYQNWDDLFDEAVSYFVGKADRGDPDAAYLIANCSLAGQITLDGGIEHCIKYLLLAGREGEPDALREAAILSFASLGSLEDVDLKAVRKILIEATRAGDGIAARYLLAIDRKVNGETELDYGFPYTVAQDTYSALSTCAKTGSGEAQFELGRYIAHEYVSKKRKMGGALAKESERDSALNLLEKAAESGSAEADFELYKFRKEIEPFRFSNSPEDKQADISGYHLNRALSRGHVEAALVVGDRMVKEARTRSNFDEGFKLLRFATKAGVGDAAATIGGLYLRAEPSKGRQFLEPNSLMAYFWLRLAYELGAEYVVEDVVTLLQDDPPFPCSTDVVVDWMLRSSRQSGGEFGDDDIESSEDHFVDCFTENPQSFFASNTNER